jgi:hypothetical protein
MADDYKSDPTSWLIDRLSELHEQAQDIISQHLQRWEK